MEKEKVMLACLSPRLQNCGNRQWWHRVGDARLRQSSINDRSGRLVALGLDVEARERRGEVLAQLVAAEVRPPVQKLGRLSGGQARDALVGAHARGGCA